MAKTVPKISFRVIAGELKGRRLSVPDLGLTRPPLTRLRKSIFDYLNPFLSGAAYLDLFSGSGSYLFEAVSRGAAKALGVELEPRLADAINKNASQLDLDQRLVVLENDVFDALLVLAGRDQLFDLIMIAPPQYQGLINKTLALLSEVSLLTSGSLIICQHDSSETDSITPGKFSLLQRRKYGNTTFTILAGGEERRIS